jgi:hypothetical protein
VSPRNQFSRRLDGPQSRSGRCEEEKNLAPFGNRIPAVQPVACRYTDWAIPIHEKKKKNNIIITPFDGKSWAVRKHVLPISQYTDAKDLMKTSLLSPFCESQDRQLVARVCIYVILFIPYLYSFQLHYSYIWQWVCRSRWPRGLRHELPSLARMLRSWVRIPLKVWMSVCAFILCLCYPVCR